MTTWDDTLRLRSYLGEEIPSGGSDADTLFTDDEIADVLTFKGVGSSDVVNMYSATAEGWERKAGKLSDLVNVVQGGATRSMSEAYDHAKDRAEYFHGLASGRGSPRSGRIVRPGTTAI